MRTYDLIIVGAGPAGLFCALHCAVWGRRVCVLEKNPSPGKKLLITGSGRCNITHAGPVDDVLAHYGTRANFVKPALLSFTNRDLMEFFSSHGCALTEDDGGKIFPASRNAATVLDVLVDRCRRQGVDLLCSRTVSAVAGSGREFVVETGEKPLSAGLLLLATGGVSYPRTGSTGDGYRFARALGHSIAGPAPALAPLIIEDYAFSDCSGISLENAVIVHYRQGVKIGKTSGDVLFTHHGLSGPGILDYSRWVQPGDVLDLSLVSGHSAADFGRMLVAGVPDLGKKSLVKALATYGVPDRLVAAVLDANDIPPAMQFSGLTRQTRTRVAKLLTACPFRVKKTGGFDQPWQRAAASAW
jgi:predicted Rossmann fold flavoprotein